MRFRTLLVCFLCACSLASPAQAQIPVLSDVFPPADAGVLAQFELNGDVLDSGGNGLHAELLGGEFQGTCFGQGLRTWYEPGPPVGAMGFDWSAHASRLVHPYTVEFVLKPNLTAPWGKLFGFSDTSDHGWYYYRDGFQDYPNAVVGQGRMRPGSVHYLALVSLGPSRIEVWFNGERIGETNTTFTAPPGQAIFFRDDTATGRREQFDGVVDAVRISNVARTAAEIAEQQQRVAARTEAGLAALQGTPAQGAASGILHGTVEPAVGEVTPEGRDAVHQVSCAAAIVEDGLNAALP